MSKGTDAKRWMHADAAPVDCISALPDDLRRRILTRLSLKEAIRTGAVARGWRDLWKGRWEHRTSVELHLGSLDDLRRELDALAREPHPRRRLDRFSLVVSTRKIKSSELRRFTEYAAECCVEDLHLETQNRTLEHKLNFHLLLSSPQLVHLSLRRIASPTCTSGAPSRSALSKSFGSTQSQLAMRLSGK